jgi:hypothetical protein
MANSIKSATKIDSNQAIKAAFNDVDASLATSGFLTAKVGRRVELAISTTTIANDTETYTFIEDAATLYQIQVVYTNGTRETLLSAERIS